MTERDSNFEAGESRPLRASSARALRVIACVGGVAVIAALVLLSAGLGSAVVRLAVPALAAIALGGGVATLFLLRREPVREAPPTPAPEPESESAPRPPARVEEPESPATDESRTRRLTDALAAAVDQLGSDKPAVRIGGLYALEQLGQDSPDHRRGVVNILCGYLRIPFDPADPAAAGELQVRLTAQRVLTEHLQPFRLADILGLLGNPSDIAGLIDAERRDLELTSGTEHTNPRFWPDMSVDLADACLVDFDFYRCRVAEAVFSRAVFHGDTRFIKARVTGPAQFDEAVFHGPVRFDATQLAGTNLFRDTVFHAPVRFDTAQVDNAIFERTRFASTASFSVTQFVGAFVTFDGSAFEGSMTVEAARFHGQARFDRVTFAEPVRLDSATFAVAPSLVGTTVAPESPVIWTATRTDKPETTPAEPLDQRR